VLEGIRLPTGLLELLQSEGISSLLRLKLALTNPASVQRMGLKTGDVEELQWAVGRFARNQQHNTCAAAAGMTRSLDPPAATAVAAGGAV
jgi:hypothetical protein